MLPDFLGNLVHLCTAAFGGARQIGGALVLWQLRVRDGPALAVKVLSYPSDEYIRWYRGITRVYIGNSANRDTRSVGYQPAGVDRRMMEVDDMASVVIQEPPSSPSQTAAFAKKVQMIIRRQLGHGAGGGRPPIPPFLGIPRQGGPRHIEMERVVSRYIFRVFIIRAPPPPGTAGSSTLHQPISQASSSDDEEWADDTDDVQCLGFGYRVWKKITRFTPSDWP
ncbi:hypothetical protein M9H77_13140 [Catharanthus roseus]|uniref:Uncharacterized protein n=1 Tax=Catharanthus roseus TaxID=4058 RepID=A0ACC0BJI3_CATRO|nr:hypothetical protein M9H77_13140 [Catharanthus roseus]